MNVMHEGRGGVAVRLRASTATVGPKHHLLLRDLLGEHGLQIGVRGGLETSDADAFIPGGQRPASPRDQATSRECPTHDGDQAQRCPSVRVVIRWLLPNVTERNRSFPPRRAQLARKV